MDGSGPNAMQVLLDGSDRDAWLAPDAEAVQLQPLQ
jgi:hypothetical protein